MKCHILFSGKNISICCLIFLFRVLSIKQIADKSMTVTVFTLNKYSTGKNNHLAMSWERSCYSIQEQQRFGLSLALGM